MKLVRIKTAIIVTALTATVACGPSQKDITAATARVNAFADCLDEAADGLKPGGNGQPDWPTCVERELGPKPHGGFGTISKGLGSDFNLKLRDMLIEIESDLDGIRERSKGVSGANQQSTLVFEYQLQLTIAATLVRALITDAPVG